MARLEGRASKPSKRLREYIAYKRRPRVYLVFISEIDALNVSRDDPEVLKAAYPSRAGALWYLARLRVGVIRSRSGAYCFHTEVILGEVWWKEGFVTNFYTD